MVHLWIEFCVDLWSSYISGKNGTEVRTAQRLAIRVTEDISYEEQLEEQLNNPELLA